MVLTKNHTHIYGFEDYKIVPLGDGYFYNTWTQYLPYGYDSSNGSYIITKDLPFEVKSIPNWKYEWQKDIVFTPELCYNHPELLENAKKIYTHSSCKLSRSMMAEKYKKSLNPWLSDAIVIPNPDLSEFNLHNVALFINENAKLIAKVYIDEDNKDVFDKMNSAEMGTKFGDLLTCTVNSNHSQYKYEDLLNAELMFVGEILYIPNHQSWALDILTNRIPTDKIVFEKSVQESLGDETNQLSFDSLTSIRDMLSSSDENTVSAGLKALSMMDWMHYPNSIKYVLSQVENKWNWVYNKAMNSTSVKFMLKSIAPDVRKRNHYPGNLDKEIYSCDFELFKQLKVYYDKVDPDRILEYIRFTNFMGVTSEGVLRPNLKG